MDDKITKEQLDQLIDDATYLQDEVEALQYVIDVVPYDQAPPEGRSIAERLLLIDHAQLAYFRPILKDAVNNPRPTHIDDYDAFEDSFEPEEEKLKDIQKLLRKLAKHRAGVINTIKNISLLDWETVVYDDERQVSLFDFIQRMIRFDRRQLNKIADLVMIFKDQRERRREIEKQQDARHVEPGNNN